LPEFSPCRKAVVDRWRQARSWGRISAKSKTAGMAARRKRRLPRMLRLGYFMTLSCRAYHHRSGGSLRRSVQLAGWENTQALIWDMPGRCVVHRPTLTREAHAAKRRLGSFPRWEFSWCCARWRLWMPQPGI